MLGENWGNEKQGFEKRKDMVYFRNLKEGWSTVGEWRTEQGQREGHWMLWVFQRHPTQFGSYLQGNRQRNVSSKEMS